MGHNYMGHNYMGNTYMANKLYGMTDRPIDRLLLHTNTQ